MTDSTLPKLAYLTVREVAARLSLSPMSVYRLLAAGSIASIRVGPKQGTYRIAPEAVDAYERASATPAPDPAPALLIPGQTAIPDVHLTIRPTAIPDIVA